MKEGIKRLENMQKQAPSGALIMAEDSQSGSALPSWELSQRVQMGWLEFVTHPHTLGCSGKPRGGTASLAGKEAVLDGMGFPSFLAPQPSRLSHELAVVFAKPPALI